MCGHARPRCIVFGVRNKNDEYILRWLTDDGLQRLAQSRLASSTDDDVDNSESVVMGALGPTKAYDTMKCREFSCGCEE